MAASLLKGVLNIGALEQSLQEILRRHECLRTTFPSIDGQPIQVIAPESSLTLPLIDLQSLPIDQRQTVALQQAAEIAQQPFDLANGPLIRATLLRLVAEEHMLIIVVHHIIFDGWSSTVFDQELAALYTAFSRGQPSPLADLPFQYADFAVWQRQWLQGEVLASQLNYWKQTLSGAPSALALPTDHPRPPIQTFRGAQEELELSETVAAALKALSQRQGATLFMTLLAAFQTLLHRYCRQDDIIVGSPIAGRHRLETEELIGLFMNTLAFRTHLGDDPSFRDLLARVREVVLGAYSHQDLPFEKLVEELQLPRDQSRTPLFQVMFTLQNFSGQPRELEGLAHEPAKVFNNTAKFDLTLTMGEMSQKLGGILEYNTDLFDGSTIKQLASNYQALLESILANPDQRLSEIPVLIPDKPQLLSDPAALSTADWNGDNPTENGMPSIDEFLSELRRLGVKLWLEGDSLRFKAARGSLNPTLLAQLQARKAEILTFLRQVRR